MDEYRGRYDGQYDAYGRREPNYREPPPPPPPECPPDCLPDCPPEPNLLTQYLPILLVILGAVGLYLWMGRDRGPRGPGPDGPAPGGLGGLGGLGGILGSFLK